MTLELTYNGRPLTVQEPKAKVERKYRKLIQECAKTPEDLTILDKFAEFENETTKELTGLTNEELEDMELETKSKITEFIYERISKSSMGFMNNLKKLQN